MESLDPKQALEAQKLHDKFSHRAEEVANLMLRDKHKIEMHGESRISDDGTMVIHGFWDGNEEQQYDNCKVEFPFEWLNLSYEELLEIKNDPKTKPETHNDSVIMVSSVSVTPGWPMYFMRSEYGRV